MKMSILSGLVFPRITFVQPSARNIKEHKYSKHTKTNVFRWLEDGRRKNIWHRKKDVCANAHAVHKETDGEVTIEPEAGGHWSFQIKLEFFL